MRVLDSRKRSYGDCTKPAMKTVDSSEHPMVSMIDFACLHIHVTSYNVANTNKHLPFPYPVLKERKLIAEPEDARDIANRYPFTQCCTAAGPCPPHHQSERFLALP